MKWPWLQFRPDDWKPASSYWPDRLDLCGPCQEDNGGHGSCAEVGGVLFMMRGSGRENEHVVCECHRVGHPTARDR